MVAIHHSNWRNRAILDSQNAFSDGVHYTAVYTMSESGFVRLKGELLNMIEKPAAN